jgi:hypothetical protein
MSQSRLRKSAFSYFMLTASIYFFDLNLFFTDSNVLYQESHMREYHLGERQTMQGYEYSLYI